MPLLLADELLLLAYHPDGLVHGGGVELDCAAAGSLLVELAMGGVVTCANDRVDPVTAAPRPADPELIAARDEIGRRPPHKPQWWVARLTRGLRRRRLTALVAAGVLAEEAHRALGGLITRHQFPERDPAPRLDAERRLHALIGNAGLATGSTEPPTAALEPPIAAIEPRTAALAALLHAAGQGEHVFGPAYRDGGAQTRLAELAAANWATPAVQAAVRAVYAGLLTASAGAALGSGQEDPPGTP